MWSSSNRNSVPGELPLSLCACIKERPGEDTLLARKRVLTRNCSQTSRFWNSEEINFCCLRHPVCVFYYGSLRWLRRVFGLFSVSSVPSKLVGDNNVDLFDNQTHEKTVQSYANIIEGFFSFKCRKYNTYVCFL